MLNPRRAIVALALVAGCTTTSGPTPEASAVPPTPSQATLAARWDWIPTPTASPGQVWAPDMPTTIGPVAFGVVPRDTEPGPALSINRFELATELPSARSEADVYLVGAYSQLWAEHVLGTVRDASSWIVTPAYALVAVRPGASLGTADSTDVDRITAIMVANGLIRGAERPRSIRTRSGVRYAFFRELNGLTVYANKVVSASVLEGGRVVALGRRRPLLAGSSYPLRSPAEAFRMLQSRRWMTMYLDDDTWPESASITTFAITKVELAYAEAEVRAPREFMQPYYVFRDDFGHAVYVPAIADRYVQAAPMH